MRNVSSLYPSVEWRTWVCLNHLAWIDDLESIIKSKSGTWKLVFGYALLHPTVETPKGMFRSLMVYVLIRHIHPLNTLPCLVVAFWSCFGPTVSMLQMCTRSRLDINGASVRLKRSFFHRTQLSPRCRVAWGASTWIAPMTRASVIYEDKALEHVGTIIPFFGVRNCQRLDIFLMFQHEICPILLSFMNHLWICIRCFGIFIHCYMLSLSDVVWLLAVTHGVVWLLAVTDGTIPLSTVHPLECQLDD